MKPRSKIRIGDLLVQNKIISEGQLQTALAEQKASGRKLGRVLVEQGMVSENQLLEFLSQQLNVPLVDLKRYQFAPDVVRLLPETYARRYRAIVLKEDQAGVVVGMADPTDIFGYDELCRILKQTIQIAMVRETDLLQTLDTVYRRTDEIVTLAEELGEELRESEHDLAQLLKEESVADLPVVKLLHSVFEDAVQIRASDIHIEPDEQVLRIRQRIDGVLQEQVIEEKRVASALITRLKLMSGLDISEKRLPQDGRFQVLVKDHHVDVRLSTLPIQGGESVVMRLLDQTGNILSVDQLGMPPRVSERYRRLMKRPHGLVLVTGPTGSGKTTTLYAALNEINDPQTKIITVEDPVEYRLSRINQVQVNPKIDLTFARVLRAVLRQDPDVVMIGEMRDQETAEIALRAAMTGHLVFSTLHTNDAVSTVNRLIDMGVPGYMVATALEGVIAQRLLRRVCDSCQQPYEPTPGERAWLRDLLKADVDRLALMTGVGCAYCNNTGYRGRVGVYELLEMDRAMTDALRRDDGAAFEQAALASPDFVSLAQVGLQYAARGVTSLAEVIRATGGVDESFDIAAPASVVTQG